MHDHFFDKLIITMKIPKLKVLKKAHPKNEQAFCISFQMKYHGPPLGKLPPLASQSGVKVKVIVAESVQPSGEV